MCVIAELKYRLAFRDQTQACPLKEVTDSSMYTRVFLQFGVLHLLGVVGDSPTYSEIPISCSLSLGTYVPLVTLVSSST